MPRKTQVTKRLECILTTEERITVSKELAEQITARAGHEAALKSFSTQKKAEMAVCDETIGLLVLKVSSGKEYRGVECNIIYAPDKCEKLTFRTDTGELVETEVMTAEELQEEMPLPPPLPPPGQDAASQEN
jgi:hypothetical protein